MYNVLKNSKVRHVAICHPLYLNNLLLNYEIESNSFAS